LAGTVRDVPRASRKEPEYVSTRDRLREKLVTERGRLKQELAALDGGERAPDGEERRSYPTHVADYATDTFEREQTMALARHLRGVLGQVERALQKMESGSYGRCERCRAPIDASRLEALPHATLCIACQSKLEAQR
jgi:RNA polymerase-binding transcription factor DksA